MPKVRASVLSPLNTTAAVPSAPSPSVSKFKSLFPEVLRASCGLKPPVTNTVPRVARVFSASVCGV